MLLILKVEKMKGSESLHDAFYFNIVIIFYFFDGKSSNNPSCCGVQNVEV